MGESQFMTLFKMLFVCMQMLVQIIGCVADRKTFLKYKEYFDVLEKELKDFEEGQKVVEDYAKAENIEMEIKKASDILARHYAIKNDL